MRYRSWILVFCFVMVVSPLAAQPTALVGGTVIDPATEASTPNATVLIEDGTITAVGASEEVAVPTSSTSAANT
jgi:imidazolonepropionase-like amidohydrolase